jgi:hypothetical protein
MATVITAVAAFSTSRRIVPSPPDIITIEDLTGCHFLPWITLAFALVAHQTARRFRGAFRAALPRCWPGLAAVARLRPPLGRWCEISSPRWPTHPRADLPAGFLGLSGGRLPPDP